MSLCIQKCAHTVAMCACSKACSKANPIAVTLIYYSHSYPIKARLLYCNNVVTILAKLACLAAQLLLASLLSNTALTS